MAIVTKEKLDRVYDAYRNGNLSRRQFIKYLGLAGACLGLMGSPFGGARQTGMGSQVHPF